MARPLLPRPAALAELFGVDLRWLAAFRISVAILVMADLWYRSRELTAFFTDAGVLPRLVRIDLYEAAEEFGFGHTWSLHMLSGQFWAQCLMFFIAAWFALWLLIGYRTRLAAITTWILLLSLDGRNPLILDSGDVLLRCLLFWSLFLPLGARCSLDAWLRPPSAPLPKRVVSPASLGLLLQLCMMYVFSAIFKTHPAWLSDRSAVYFALNCDAFATSWGLWVRQFPLFMEGLTFLTYWLELLGPLIVFVPWLTGWIRGGVVLSFWLFHLGLATTLALGLFPPICMAAWLVFLPSGIWDWLSRRQTAISAVRQIRRLGLWLGSSSRLASPSWFGRPEQPKAGQPLIVHFAVLALVSYVFVWNVRELNMQRWEQRLLPRQYNGLARALGLDQNWAMFSPIPRTEDGWLVMKGVLRDGSEVNLWEPGQPLPWDKPVLVSATYRSQRWRKYLDNLTTDVHAGQRMYLADWLRNRWNRLCARAQKQREVVEVELIQRLEITPPPGQPIPRPEDRSLWKWYYE